MKIKNVSRSVFELIGLLLLSTIMTVSVASAQVVDDNVNVTGTPAPGYNNGQLARQENEPSCGENPLNELNKMCAYNWYGFSDLPDDQGDAWIAFSETVDGRNFIRRPLTGTKLNFPIGKAFAADPTMLVFPGGAMVTSIAGDRGGNSVMILQRMMELNREFGFRHVSEAGQIVIESLQGVHFIDKPDAEIIIDPNGGTRSVTMTLEEKDEFGNNLVVTREWPNFRIVVTFADFNSSGQNIRTWSTFSDDFGITWSNKRQISNTSGLDQGLSIADRGSELLYVWRRFDSGEGRASIVAALSKDRGNKTGKVFEITDVCEFDQLTAPNPSNPDRASARSNGFPWISATGSHFVLAYTERPRDGLDGLEGNCLADYSGTAGTRIMIRTSTNGKTWSDAVPVTPFNKNRAPFTPEEFDPDAPPVHFQYMPNLACARGTCNVIFYSTLTESMAYEALLGGAVATRHWEENPFIEDFNVNDVFNPETGLGLGLLRYRRTLDIFSSKITIGAGGRPMPSVTPERVSIYQTDPSDTFEIEWNSPNILNYGGNSVPFFGDYVGLGVSEWRRNITSGEWEDNASPIGPIADAINRMSYFAAWTDNRRVRGAIYDDVFFTEDGMLPMGPVLPYEVPDEIAVVRNDGDDAAEEDPSKNPDQSYATERLKITGPGAPFIKKMVAERRPDRFLSAYARTAEGVEDPNPNSGTCSPTIPPTHADGYQTRIKDSEIYGATIEDRVRLVSPTVAKNLGQIQRGFVIGSENIDPDFPRTLRLVIGNQPGEVPDTNPVPVVLPTARASWRQLPFGPNFFLADPLPVLEETVTIQPLSTEYVTVYVVSQDPDAPVTVFAFDETDALVSQITVNGETEAGDLIDPGTTLEDVLFFEIHDPDLIEPIFADLEINPLSPNYKNPNFKNPNFKNPNFKNTDYMDPNLKNPNFKNPNYKNVTEEAPNLKNPNLKNPNLKNIVVADSFIDATYTVVSNNNTTTAMNVDFAFGGDELDDLDIEVIAWQADELDSLQDCTTTGLITESKVISAKSNPNFKNLAPADIADPFQGFVSFPLAPNGEVNVTVRIFCVNDAAPGGCIDLTAPDADGNTKLSQFLGFNFWSQKANTGKDEITEQEIKDVIPPLLNLCNGGSCNPIADDHMFRAVAADSNGVDVDITTGTGTIGNELISADDSGTPADVNCNLSPAGTPMPPAVTMTVGTTNVTCGTQDTATPPNEATWTGTIRVEDHEPPVLTIPAATLTRPPTSAAGANVDYLAANAFGPGLTLTATDTIDPNVELSCVPASGSLFPIGNTTVTCTATDDGPNASGVPNSVTDSFTVAIVDAEAPVINGGNPLAAIVVEATAVSTPVTVPLPPVADPDLIDPSPVISRDPTITVFPLGDTILTWTVTDFTGNSSTATQTVTVQDTTRPVITLLGDDPLTLEAGPGAYVDPGATVSDIVDPSPILSVDFSAVNTAVVDTYLVHYTAVDASGVAAIPVDRTVIVEDTTPPVITLLGDDPLTLEAGSGAYVDPGATVSDIADPSPLLLVDFSAVNTAIVGNYSVLYDAVDASGVAATQVIRIVIVQDTTDPVLTIPLAAAAEATSPSGAPVPFSPIPSAVDSVDTNVPVICTAFSPAVAVVSGSPFPIGSTTVSCTATDDSGNSAFGQFVATVVDTAGPSFSNVPANFSVESSSPAGTPVNYTPPTASDLAQDVPVTCSPSSGSTFALGNTTVTCTATDGTGVPPNTSTATFVVSVVDTTPPVIVVPDAPGLEFVADSVLGTIVDYSASVSVSDNADPNPTLVCAQPTNTVFAPGTTIVTCDSTTVTAAEPANNAASANFDITVLFDDGGGIAFGKGKFINPGSVVPLTWSWKDSSGNNVLIDSSQQQLEITDCVDATVFFVFPGSSGFLLVVDSSWQVNWQTVDEFGNDLDPGDYCARVDFLDTTVDPPTVIQSQISDPMTIRRGQN